MKGIVMERREQKSIVLFNNGKIGEIPTPPNCEEGMVITISYNRRLIMLICFLSCIALLGASLALRSVYIKPLGYIQINYDNAAVELAYNRFKRIIAVRPLNFQTVEPIAALSLNNTRIENAYEKIMRSFTSSTSFLTPNLALVRIAQDNLAEAKKLERSLSLLSSTLMTSSQKELTVTFELYTHELYREAMTAASQNSAFSPMPPQGGGSQMMRRGMNRGMNMWCW
jgi:hypothetical protein